MPIVFLTARTDEATRVRGLDRGRRLRGQASYAEIHLARGEWRDCLEVSRSILHNCEEALTPAERTQLYERLSVCAHHLGDDLDGNPRKGSQTLPR